MRQPSETEAVLQELASHADRLGRLARRALTDLLHHGRIANPAFLVGELTKSLADEEHSVLDLSSVLKVNVEG